VIARRSRHQQAHWIMRAKVDSPGSPEGRECAARSQDEVLMSATAAIPGRKTVRDPEAALGGIVLDSADEGAAGRAWAQEYYGAHPAPPEDASDDAMDQVRWRTKWEDEMESLKEPSSRKPALGRLRAVDPVRALEFSGDIDPGGSTPS